MKSGPEIEKRLSTSGLRLTPQRRTIIRLLAGNTDHPSAEDIFLKARGQFPMLSFATVYNTLKVLETMGEVQALRVGGEDRTLYDPRTDLHGHFYCQKCRNVVDIETGEYPAHQLAGHHVEGCQVHYHGVCVDCLRSLNG